MALSKVAAAAVITLFGIGAAQAFPAAPAPIGAAIDAAPGLTLVRGGCGWGAHQGPMGGCRLNAGPRGRMRAMMGGAPRGCPPGTHPTGRGYCARNY